MVGYIKKKRCEHKKNYILDQWISKDTPVLSFVCLDCGFKDFGHVYGDAIDWEKHTECKNGIIKEVKFN